MKVKDRLKDFFTRQPYPSTVFQLTGPAVIGLHVEGKEHKTVRHASLALRPGSLEPSFDRPNLKDPAHVGDKVRDALQKIGQRDGNVSLLVPESCLKSSILVFDDLPEPEAERRSVLAWRLKKQYPSLPDDARLSYEILNGGKSRRVFVSAIHPAVLAEYEGLFARQGAAVKNVNLATLSLAGLIPGGEGGSGIVANLEEDGLSLLAIIDSEIIFYRSKPFLPDGREARSPARKVENIGREILNTLTFLEDREKKKVDTLWIRTALADADEEALAALKPMLPVAIRPLEPGGLPGLRPREARLLAPLIGQLP